MYEPIRSIVVGVAAPGGDDPSAGSSRPDPALASAAALARSAGATLHVVHAYELPAPALAGLTLPLPPDARRRYAAAITERVRAQAAGWPGVDVRCHVVEGSAAEAICDTAARLHAALVVVGATRRGRVWRGLTGSTAEGVVRAATVPVLVLRQPLALPIRRVLLTTDLSDESEALLERGVAAAGALAELQPELRLLLVVASDPLVPPPWEEALALRGAEHAVRRLGGRIGVAVEASVRGGEVSLEIVREADEWKADLLVLGTHGRSGFRRLWLGGTAASALRGAPCNVLMVPAAPARLESPALDADAGHAAGRASLLAW
jgi:nucleotide-binding universal stress UspA family protein